MTFVALGHPRGILAAVKTGFYVLILVLLTPAYTQAEMLLQRGTSAAEQAVRSDKRMAVSVLRNNEHLMVSTNPSTPNLEGSFAGTRGDTLLVAVDGEIIPIPIDAMDELWVYERWVKGGAFIGTLAGLSMAAVVTLLAVATDSNSFTTGNDYIVTVGLYTLAGGTIGAIAGLKRRWQHRYP